MDIKIAVLSGKGGTGKTFVSVNLAACARGAYVDCDVEEPNGRLFFKPENAAAEPVTTLIPVFDESRCTGCRECTAFCKFNALVFLFGHPVLFPTLCHSCGGCVKVCKHGAVTETANEIGTIAEGVSDGVSVLWGTLNIAEVSGVPIIEALRRKAAAKSGVVVTDCPPGSACSVMESVRDADYCLLVAEPTIFGAHNLKMVWELVRRFGKPAGVILNKCADAEDPSKEFCVDNGVEIIAEIPFDRELGELNSNGGIAARESERYRSLFSDVLGKIMSEAQR